MIPTEVTPLPPAPATPLAQSAANIGVQGNTALANLTSGITPAGAPVAPGNATPNAPAAMPGNTYITPPQGLQGMPINPAPMIAQQGAQDYQQQLQSAAVPQQPPEQQKPQANQTMMLAAAKKAAEDRRMAQIAAHNQSTRNAASRT